MDYMSSPVLETVAEMSTFVDCCNCGVLIDEIEWMQCEFCKAFDLCGACARISYEKLPRPTLESHKRLHQNTPIPNGCLRLVSIEQAKGEGIEVRLKKQEMEYQRIIKEKKIKNNYEMSVIMNKVVQNNVPTDNEVKLLIADYHLTAHQRNIRVLSLDGGGIRGYMPIKVLSELIVRKHSPDIAEFSMSNPEHRPFFQEAQKKFSQNFDYFVGTGTGGLTAFCLAVNYNILDMMEMYSDASHHFKRNRFGPWFCPKYDPSRIHKKIDEIIDQIKFPIYGKISSKHATLLDLRNLLNPENPIVDEEAEAKVPKQDNSLQFVDDTDSEATFNISDAEDNSHAVKYERALFITAYNATKRTVTIFNTSNTSHWRYRIADVLKSTMAAPTHFPPHQVYQGDRKHGHFRPDNTSELFIDGGMFANDPELAALWAVRMQWKKPVNYHLLSVGTGCSTSTLSSSSIWVGYLGWLFNKGFLVNTLIHTSCNHTETTARKLSKFGIIKRMKLNYEIAEQMDLDDPDFARIFNKAWNELQNGVDFKGLLYFYDKYMKQNVSFKQ